MPPHNGGVRQCETLARSLPYGLGREKWLKDSRLNCFRNAASRVTNGDLYLVTIWAGGGDPYRSFASRAIAHYLADGMRRVDQQIENHLIELACMAAH